MTSTETPAWVRDAIFYEIFPDRFAYSRRLSKPSHLEPWDSPPTVFGFKGGDLFGVVEHLDYLQDLGVTAIYFTPVFQSAANHRYHTFDYYRVDPLLGGNEALRILLDEAHHRNMHVILDGVFNHASRGFFQFHHLAENGAASPYADWFIIKKYPVQPYPTHQNEHGYDAWWGLPALPKLNIATPSVRQYLWDVACHWVEFGIDGWRLDVPGEIDDDEFWREFRHRVKTANPQAYIVGEIWHDGQRWLQGDQFDAVMNYQLARACLGFFVGEHLLWEEVASTGYHQIHPLDAQAFANEAERLLRLYPQPVIEVQLNLLGSHDTPRFRTLARGDCTAYRLATLFQMTYPGAPCIYYGDEIGLEGKHDPGCRGTFPWDEHRWDQDLRDFVRRCIALRKAHPALRAGDLTWLYAGQGVIAFGRRCSSDTVVVILNSSRWAVTVDLPLAGYLQPGTVLHDPWEARTVTVNDGQMAGIQVPARSGLALTTGETT